MLGFGSISESPISAFSISGNNGRSRILVEVISTSYGRVLVTGSGSGIITIGSSGDNSARCYHLHAGAAPDIYVRDASGKRLIVSMSGAAPDIYVRDVSGKRLIVSMSEKDVYVRKDVCK
jgi:hypothetical protein